MTKLTVGRGWNRRITKAGEAAMVRFDELVVAHLRSLGATPPESHLLPRWTLQTTVGLMRVVPHGHWIHQCFLDWDRAKAAGFDHWKWNFHYEVGAAEMEVEHWKRALSKILPEVSQ